MRVKICGITRAQDAVAAAELGVWAIGFVFHPQSPRFISPNSARRITDSLPQGILKIGVFVSATADDVSAVMRAVHLDAVQTYGKCDFDGTAVQRIRSVTLRTEDDVTAAAAASSGQPIHVDSTAAGSGTRSDWRLAAQLSQMVPIILAGGLDPTNVGGAAECVHPFAVDVSSGVERSPGIKDTDLMRRFIEAVQLIPTP